jgi:hypothetical protein
MAQPIWITPAGSLGLFPSNIEVSYQLLVEPVPEETLTYKIISGSLPAGLTISTTGLISGIPQIVPHDVSTTFTVRVTDESGNLRDRTFIIGITGLAAPKFVTPMGLILSVQDSNWVEYPLDYSNPIATNPIVIELNQGLLPPGLEINEAGIIRGYPNPPEDNVTAAEIVTFVTSTNGDDNYLTCPSTLNFIEGRPIVFTGDVFGNLVEDTTYFIKEINSLTKFSVSVTANGPVFLLSTGTGNMTATLAPISVGTPTIRTYNFSLNLISPLGNDSASYSITVINQNAPIDIGGPGNPEGTRPPTILNTRPTTFNLADTDPYYGYYIVPPKNSSTLTIAPTIDAGMGTYQNDNYFAYKIIAYDFDGDSLTYAYSALPLGLTGDPATGWITGTPILYTTGITSFDFTVYAYKTSTPSITTDNFNFKLYLSNEVVGDIVWTTDSNLGTVSNGTISTLRVAAISDVPLQYEITNGNLPPNLVLLSNGEITGTVADQPTDEMLDLGDTTTFTFTVNAYSPSFPAIISSTREFTLTVRQDFSQPTDILYIKATPSIEDRTIIDSLLNNTSLIPNEYLYRPDDINFGKASSVIYEHAFGINASNLDQYIAAVTKNHYWRNITLGEIKTASARNENGDILYEVVYSEVIDNLVNPQGTSVPEEIVWPRDIDLFLGPWYTSVTNIYTSYDDILTQQYYTSLTSGRARVLYPNSLYDMRTRIAQELGQVYDRRLLPAWMTSQQSNGGTLGYTQAWVICYTKFGYTTDANGNQITYANKIKNSIETDWPYTLNEVNFKIDRFSVNKSNTYNYDTYSDPQQWTDLPSASPTPDPIDSRDFYVLFPRQTILPDESQ